MSSPQIGVHLADHSFFPIFETDSPGRKRVLLSTSHTDQECVDIVLYRRDPTFVEEEERLGHILLCDIARGTPGESEIELVLDLHGDGTIEATATDRRSGNSQTVAIDERDAMPEYHEGDQFAAGSVEALYDDELIAEPPVSRRRSWIIWLWLFLLILAAGVVVWYFLLRPADAGEASGNTTMTQQNEVQNEVRDEMPEASDAPPLPTVVDADVDDAEIADVDDADDGEAAAAPAENRQPISPEDYNIKWGDTLWDISKVFYGTPWRFKEIADENAITDPDRIYADDRIKIPRE